MKKLAITFLAVGTQMFLSGCTVRYSQTIGGSIQKVENFKVVKSESGTDVGLDNGGAYMKVANGIAFSDPLSSKKIADYPCDFQFVQVDYRSIFYVYWFIRVDFPKAEVTAYCVKQQKEASLRSEKPQGNILLSEMIDPTTF